jgi:hypothetical protein
MKYILLFIITIYLFMICKQQTVYDVAYQLSTNFLDNLDYNTNYAVMFDIDDTIIFSQSGKPIKPIIKLMKYCNKKGFLVIIITARPNNYKKETIAELENNKIYSTYDNFHSCKSDAFYDFIYLRKSPQDDNIMFKSKIKELLLNKNGIFTVMSLGDNEIDVIGDYSGYCIKLPNTHDPRLFHKDIHGRMVQVKI